MREIELPAYFERIGLGDAPTADLGGLEALQHAHLLSIPFENLDIPLGRGISVDPARVFEKLVTSRRGGYCFEHNLIFLAVLHARSEEHTSELQSLMRISYAVFCLKKQKKHT